MASKSIIVFLLFLALLMYNSQSDRQTNLSLYFQEFSGGHSATIVPVIPPSSGGNLNFSKFGTTFIADDDLITQGPERNSPQIGRCQGTIMASSLDGSNTVVLLSIVFTNGKYKGSTLQMQGSSPQFENVTEVAVVGGTGVFRLARGFSTLQTISSEPTTYYAIIQCNITVFQSWTKPGFHIAPS